MDVAGIGSGSRMSAATLTACQATCKTPPDSKPINWLTRDNRDYRVEVVKAWVIPAMNGVAFRLGPEFPAHCRAP
jgi:hypothetical protein